MTAQTMIVSGRGGCQRIEMTEPPLARRIETVLRRANRARLTLRQIGGALKLPMGHDGEAWQNVCRLSYELAKLQEGETIRFAVPDAHWIEPPREEHDPVTGEVRR
jgi:hypothetical protein